jgi:hypothetical protein
METESSFPYSQQPATGPYTEPDESSPHHPTQFPQDPFQYYPPTTPSPPLGLPTKISLV